MFEFLWKPSCSHEQITPNMKAGYCPECGEYVINRWYISRCKCCGVKQKTLVRNGKVIASAKFCKNCGSNAFITEELKEIDIVTINYAAVLKQVEKTEKQGSIRTWVEETMYAPMKLLPAY